MEQTELLNLERKYLKYENSFRYMLLNRMQIDCEYYLGNGGKNKNSLWAKNEELHIKFMESLWNSFEEKPEWLTLQQLNNYSIKLTGKNL